MEKLIRVAIVETSYPKQRLLLEVLSQYNKKLELMIGRSCARILDVLAESPQKVPDYLILGHHLPFLDAKKELAAFMSDTRVSGVRICIISDDRYISADPDLQQLGIHHYLSWNGRPSDLKRQLSALIFS